MKLLSVTSKSKQMYSYSTIKVQIIEAINYVCSWLFFDVSTLKHVLK